ncbi:MAG TPA: ABC transporter substrate-binding protein, partial [Polyangiaceae bacterium LLY-WYZ-15_(1-7)]|nr:ABC transporter substrate-binding protein [Polyangiaceae bacterium LLY-WYZ-15_(1-7)]
AVVLELPEEHGRLVPDAAGSGMAERFSLTDWLYEPEFHPRVERRTVSSDLGLLSREGLPTTVHHVAYEVRLQRPILTVALKLFLPLAIIALVALVALFLPAETVAPRSSIGVTALLSCFAFQFTVAGNLPSVTYLTLADLLFLIAYVLSSAALIVTIAAHALQRRGRADRALLLDRGARVVLPLAAGVAVALAIPEPASPPAPEPAPVPARPRPTSTRGDLVIGANRISTLLASTAWQGVGWSLMPTPPGAEEPLPLAIERVPGIDNELVRFAASGEVEVTWRLREGLMWSDGRPLVARDLTLPWDAFEPEHALRWEAPDDRTLVVTWDGRLAQALESPLAWPSHVLDAVFEEGSYDAIRDHRRAHPVPALGPYRVASYADGEEVVLEPNPHFVGSAPAIGRVVERRMEVDALIAAFLAGEVDITIPNAITMEQARQIARERPEAVRIRPGSGFIFLHPDLEHPLLRRRAVRRALLQAIDREILAAEVYGEAGRVAHVPVPGEPPPGTERVAHDREAARAALEELGATETALPLLHGPSATDREIATHLARDLQEAGVTVDLREVPSSHRAYLARGHGGLLLHIVRGLRDAPPRRYWNLPIVQGTYSASARHDAYDDEVDALVEREKHALYPERRAQLRDALLALTSERLPNLPLLFAAERILADPALQGWDFGPTERFGAGLERWHFADPPER